MAVKIFINNSIRALQMRVIGSKGENLGVITKEEALAKAKSAGLDLIEVSPNADPVICKIMDYGLYQYTESKKQKEVKAKSHNTETKNIQISVGISDHDIEIKTRQGADWLKEGHRVKIDLQLKGRAKYMDQAFLVSRLDRVLAIIPAEYKIAEPLKKMPKGMYIVLEKAK